MAREPVNIVILGGSFAGLTIAHQFLRSTIEDLGQTRTAPAYKVVLVSPSTHFFWNIGAPRLIGAPRKVTEKEAFLEIAPGFQDYNEDKYRFIQGHATGVDFGQKTVTIETLKVQSKRASNLTNPRISQISSSARSATTASDSGAIVLPYHALIVCTGTSAHCPLLSLHGNHEKTVDAFDSFHTSLLKASSVVVVGGGPSGVECAGQLAAWDARAQRAHALPLLWRKAKRVTRLAKAQSKRISLQSWGSKGKGDASSGVPADAASDVSDDLPKAPLRITLISGNERLLPKLPASVGAKAERMLKGLGVHVMHNVRLVANKSMPSRSTQCVLSNEMSVQCDLVVKCTGLEANTSFLPHELLDASGYVVVDQKRFRVPRAGERVYAVGDCISLAKNSILDIYDCIPVLMHNLRNDLWQYEYKLQNPYGGCEEKLEALEDRVLDQDPRLTQICPITRLGGVGVLRGRKLPAWAFWLLKGRTYQFPRAKRVVENGGKPLPGAVRKPVRV